MAGAKLVVIYPPPTDAEAFEKVYAEEHLPLATKKISGMTKAVLTKVVDAPGGGPAFHRIAEIHFPSMEALQASLASEGTREAAAHAQSISTGGPIVMLVCEEQIVTF
jgi:uncharacterized protein (TIGR02118 family)